MEIKEALERANKIANEDYHLRLGMERKAISSVKDGKTLIRIDCYTLSGNYKGNYKCGNIDADGNYTTGKYDEVDLEAMKYIGR